LISLHGQSLDGGRVAIPVSMTHHATAMVEERRGSAVLSPTAPAAIMESAASPFMAFAGDTEGRFIVPEFMPAFDATATFVRMLDLLARDAKPLSDTVDALPSIHMEEREVVTPWDQKGSVMRELVEQSNDRQLDLVDGVRIHHDHAWALVLPDPEDPTTKVVAEGPDLVSASRLADEYVRRIEQLIRP